MSDQSKPAEIEDVLSSIRRLVAGASAPLVAPSDDEPRAQDPAAKADALMLTPSLRVEQEMEDREQPTPTTQAWSDDAAADLAAAADGDAESNGGDPEGVALMGAASDEPAAHADPAEGASETEADVAFSGSREEHEGEHRDPQEADKPPSSEFEHRKSPFLTDTMIAKRAAMQAGTGQDSETRRTGFGFGAARRDDPVRHVPISDLGPLQAPAQTTDDAAPETPQRHPERTLNLSIASDDESDEGVRATEQPLPASRGADPVAPLISSGFSLASAPAGRTPDAHGQNASDTLIRNEAPDGSSAPGSAFDEATAQSDLSIETDSQSDANARAPEQKPEDKSEDNGLSLLDEDPGLVELPAPDDASASLADRGATLDFLPEPEPESLSAPPTVAGANEAERAGPVSPSSVAEPDPGALNVFDHDAERLDDAALRALITDVVHRELQGVLGERVSRNIRLLVRREVARALEERDLA